MASQWMTVSSTSARWPSDGEGGATATNTSSITATNTRTAVQGILLLTAHSAITTITIMAHDGTTAKHTLTIAANQPCPLPIPIGGVDGIGVGSGISAKTSNAATTCELYFNTLDKPSGI